MFLFYYSYIIFIFLIMLYITWFYIIIFNICLSKKVLKSYTLIQIVVCREPTIELPPFLRMLTLANCLIWFHCLRGSSVVMETLLRDWLRYWKEGTRQHHVWSPLCKWQMSNYMSPSKVKTSIHFYCDETGA